MARVTHDEIEKARTAMNATGTEQERAERIVNMQAASKRLRAMNGIKERRRFLRRIVDDADDVAPYIPSSYDEYRTEVENGQRDYDRRVGEWVQDETATIMADIENQRKRNLSDIPKKIAADKAAADKAAAPNPNSGGPRKPGNVADGSSGAPTAPYTAEPVPSATTPAMFHDRNGRGDSHRIGIANMELNPTSEYEKTVRDNAIHHNSSMAQMRMDDEIRQAQRERLRRRSEYIDQQMDRFHRIGDQWRYDRREFSSQRGWDNLAREGSPKGQQIDGYDDRMKVLLARADQLKEAFAKGDYTGRGKEFAAIMDAVNNTHGKGGGLTNEQMEALEKKMDSMRKGLNKRAQLANEANEFYRQRELRNRRAAVGDAEGLLTDDQVDKLYGDNQRKIVSTALKGVVDWQYTPDVKLQSGGNAAMKDILSKNGVDFRKLAGMAYQSGAYGDLFEKYRTETDPVRKREAMDNMAIAYLRDNMDLKADKSNQKAYDVIDGMINPTRQAAPKNDLLVWRDQQSAAQPAAPRQTQGAPEIPAKASPKAETTPRNGATVEAATQPAATQPAATQPAATQPAATQPAATQPAATQPEGGVVASPIPQKMVQEQSPSGRASYFRPLEPSSMEEAARAQREFTKRFDDETRRKLKALK